MSCKYVDPVRWQTPDFFELPSSSKLLFCYLYDNCDLAGFIPVNKPLWSVYTGIPKDELDKVIDKNGIKIIGESNILNKLPVSASNLYSKNIFNFVSNLYDKETKKININLEDEIIAKTIIK